MIQLTNFDRKPIYINVQRICYVTVNSDGETLIQLEHTHINVLEVLDVVLDKLDLCFVGGLR